MHRDLLSETPIWTDLTHTTILSFPWPSVALVEVPRDSVSIVCFESVTWMKEVLVWFVEVLRLSPVDFDFFTFDTCSNLAVNVSRFFPNTRLSADTGSTEPITRRLGVVSAREAPGPVGGESTHPCSASSPLAYGEVSAEDETSPRCTRGREREVLK